MGRHGVGGVAEGCGGEGFAFGVDGFGSFFAVGFVEGVSADDFAQGGLGDLVDGGVYVFDGDDGFGGVDGGQGFLGGFLGWSDSVRGLGRRRRAVGWVAVLSVLLPGRSGQGRAALRAGGERPA